MKTAIIITGLALAVSAFTVSAQTGPRGGFGRGPGGPAGSGGPEGAGQRPPPCPILAAIDADKDHSLSAAEIANAPTALASLDANSDGQLTVEEIRPLPLGQGQGNGQVPAGPPKDRPGRGQHQGRGPGGQGGPNSDGGVRPPAPWLAALDVNSDRVLDAQEIANASAALLTLDKDSDGVVSAEELRPAGRGPGGPHGFGPGGPHGLEALQGAAVPNADY